MEQDLDLDRELETAYRKHRPEDASLLIFTGGTTGVPKAALLSHRNTTGMSWIEAQRLLFANGIEPGAKWPVMLPPSHAGGTIEVIGMGLVAGFEMIMASPWSPRGILELTEAESLEVLVGVPTMLAILLGLPDLESYDLSSLQIAFMSGEKVSLELFHGVQEKLCHRVVCGYGSTEAGAEVTLTSVGDDPEEVARGYVGQPLPGVMIRVIDNAGRTLPAGENGEIIIGGPYAITSYFEMPEEDAAGFTEDGWVKSGDLGFLSPEGGLYITGRKKQIIRVGSYTVLPAEIEEVVLEHPGVALAAALGVPDPILGEKVWLFVAAKEGAILDSEEMVELCRDKLAKFKVPEKVFVRGDLPVTRIGKVDRAALTRETLESKA